MAGLLAAALFRPGSMPPFDWTYFINTLRKCLRAIDFPVHFSNRFRRGEAQRAADNGILDEDIQTVQIVLQAEKSYQRFFSRSESVFGHTNSNQFPNRTSWVSIYGNVSYKRCPRYLFRSWTFIHTNSKSKGSIRGPHKTHGRWSWQCC